MLGDRVGVLTAAGAAGWEVAALQSLGADPRVVVLKRCVDLHDLLASAATGEAEVAVVAADLAGLDSDSVARLRRAGATVVVVTPVVMAGTSDADGRDVRRLGVSGVVPADAMAGLADAVVRAAEHREGTGPDGQAGDVLDGAAERLRTDERPLGDGKGRLVAVWGPTGAPGRTTLAVAVAAELASRGRETFLLDVDGYGGAVAQHLGVLDEASGLLSAARLANAGHLDQERLAAAARRVGPHLRVLTGLPRADRWAEVREVAFDALLDLAPTMCAYAVLDLGFNLEQDALGFGGLAPGRNHMALAGLERADEVLVVGSADPVGLARLARGLVELLEVVPGGTLRVVVNRMRASLGWSEREISSMIEGFVTPASIHFVPYDAAAADRALVGGRPLTELGDSRLREGVSGVVDALAGTSTTAPRRRLRRRTTGRGR